VIIDGIEIGTIDHFNTSLADTLNYSYNTIVNLRNSQITTPHAKSFRYIVSSPVVSWHLTVGILQLHRLRVLFTDSPTNLSELLLLLSLLKTYEHGLHRKHRSLIYSNNFREKVFICESVTQ
jgi:hypothetical protein